jgi:hypothetical protein
MTKLGGKRLGSAVTYPYLAFEILRKAQDDVWAVGYGSLMMMVEVIDWCGVMQLRFVGKKSGGVRG